MRIPLMGRNGIYGGWTDVGTRRVWVRVPTALKNANGNGDRGVDAAELPVVLVHGIGGSGRRVEPLLLALGESRPVFAPDLPGFGFSDAPPGILDVPGLADSLRRWMLDNGIHPAVLVATTSGCQIAVDLAARHPELVERLVLARPTMDPESRSAGSLARRWALSLSRESVQRAPSAVRDIIDAGPWRTVRTLERAFDDPIERKLPRVEAPTLVMRSESDRLAPEGWAKRIAESIPGAELQTIPAGPGASAASAASALAGMIDAFLSSDASQPEAAAPSNGHVLDPRRLIVDGMNVIGSRPDGWWRNRPKAWRELRMDLERCAREHGDDVVLVIDGKRPAGWGEDELVETAFAAGGRGAADDAIIARVKADPNPSSLCIVTSDRELAARAGELGASTMPAASFRAELS